MIFGGVKRIANFAEVVVPFMAAGFIPMAIVIMIINYDRVPEMFNIIFSSAFGTHAAFGAMMAWRWSGASSAASTPTKLARVRARMQRLPGSLAPGQAGLRAGLRHLLRHHDGVHRHRVPDPGQRHLANVYSPAGASAPPIFQGLAGIPEGAGYAQAGVEAVLPGWGSAFVSIAIFFFAFTTIMAYYYMAETNLSYVNHNKKRPLTVLVLRLGIIGMVVFGAFHNATLAWALVTSASA